MAAPEAPALASLVVAGLGRFGAPIYEIHNGDYLSWDSQGIVMLTNNEEVPPFNPLPALRRPCEDMRLDNHVSVNNRRNWFRAAGPTVDAYNHPRYDNRARVNNANGDAITATFGRNLGGNIGKNQSLAVGKTLVTISGNLNSDITFMLHLPAQGTVGGIMPVGGPIPGPNYGHGALSTCVQRILNRAATLPQVSSNAAFPWRVRPARLAFHLIGSNQGYGFEQAAETLVKTIVTWFEHPTLGPLRRSRLPQIEFLIPVSGTAPIRTLTQDAWLAAWMNHIGGPRLPPVPAPQAQAQAQAEIDLRTRVLRSGRRTARQFGP